MLFDDELYEAFRAGDRCRPGGAERQPVAAFRHCLKPSSHCHQKATIACGWERYGQQVSANSVNQSIAQIRRCLSTVGHCDYVVTVPRIGYKISDALSIERLGESAFAARRRGFGRRAKCRAVADHAQR